MTSASSATSRTVADRRPASSAFAHDFEPGYSPTTTLQPLSLQVQRVRVPLRCRSR